MKNTKSTGISAVLSNIFAGMALCSLSSAQVTSAYDWNRTACGTTNQYQMFNLLDSGYVIVQEFVMMSCSPCVTAGNGLKVILAEFAGSNPFKVLDFKTGFDATTTCAEMLSWASANNFASSTLFEDGAAEVSYYGGMGMPTIVVLGGGSSRLVYYLKQGYSPSDNNNIRNAITQAISESPGPAGAATHQTGNSIQLWPNPAQNVIQIQTIKPINKFQILSTDGKLVAEDHLMSPDNIHSIDITYLVSGFYFLQVETNGIRSFQKFFKW
jgi:hypothetical protein